MAFAATLDHLVVAAATLDEGAAWLEAKLGVPLAPGGKHAVMGTHNRLLKLGPKLYLEVIAIDPAAPAPGRPRWFGLDDPAVQARLAERPRLVHWVARCEDIAALADTEILDMARGDFRWRISIPADGLPPLGGLLPALIEWANERHPADGLPESGCELMKLEGFHPDAGRVGQALAALGLDKALAVFPTAPDEAPGLVAYLKTPAGLVEID